MELAYGVKPPSEMIEAAFRSEAHSGEGYTPFGSYTPVRGTLPVGCTLMVEVKLPVVATLLVGCALPVICKRCTHITF